MEKQVLVSVDLLGYGSIISQTTKKTNQLKQPNNLKHMIMSKPKIHLIFILKSGLILTN